MSTSQNSHWPTSRIVYFLIIVTFCVTGIMSLCFSTRAVVTAPLRTGEHFFMLLPTIILGLGVAMMLFPNPIHNLLCLIAIFGGTVVLYLHAGAEFLGFTFLIVFVGAVAILFLFVIMLLNIRSLASIDHTMNRKGRLACVAFPVILVLVYSFDCLRSAVVRSYTVESSALLLATTPGSTVEELYSFINHRFHDILIFAELLYTQYWILFFLVSLLLLSAMIGAITLSIAAMVPTNVPFFTYGEKLQPQ